MLYASYLRREDWAGGVWVSTEHLHLTEEFFLLCVCVSRTLLGPLRYIHTLERQLGTLQIPFQLRKQSIYLCGTSRAIDAPASLWLHGHHFVNDHDCVIVLPLKVLLWQGASQGGGRERRSKKKRFWIPRDARQRSKQDWYG